MKDPTRWSWRDYNYEMQSIKAALKAGNPYLDRDRYGTERIVPWIDILIHQVQYEGIRGDDRNSSINELVELLRELQQEARLVEKQYVKTKSSKENELWSFKHKNFLYRFFHRKQKKHITEELEQLERMSK